MKSARKREKRIFDNINISEIWSYYLVLLLTTLLHFVDLFGNEEASTLHMFIDDMLSPKSSCFCVYLHSVYLVSFVM